MRKHLFKAIVLMILSLVLISCRSNLPNNSSLFENSETSSSIINYYTEHFEDIAIADYHFQLCVGAIKPFNEGDTVKLDDLLQYFRMFEMTIIPTNQPVNELKPYCTDDNMMEFKVPKQVVVDMLTKHFSVNINSDTSDFEDKDDKDYLNLAKLFVDAGTSTAVSEKVNITEGEDITVIRFDELRVEKVEEEETNNPKYFYSKVCESEIGVRNYGTDDVKFVYYKRVS